MDILNFKAGNVTLFQVKQSLQKKMTLALKDDCKEKVLRSRKIVDDILKRGDVVYGINTGFGKLADKKISPENLIDLQHNLLRSHAVGTGDLLNESISKLIIFLKINCMAQGFSGIRWELIDYLQKLYNSDICPCIPAKGSVGASGDLAPLAHLSLFLIGEGRLQCHKKILSAEDALNVLKLKPLALQPKEGLALINGTQVSTAILCYALVLTQYVFNAAICAGALSWVAIDGLRGPLDPRIHKVRKSPDQEVVARVLSKLIKPIPESKEIKQRVQDPYSIRCQPQVMGACLAVMKQVAQVLKYEINAVTDNPLIFSDSAELISGGNFHAEPIAFAADQLACAIAEIGNLSERRINLLCDENFSGLPNFLIKENGLHSGFMIAQVTAAALCSENKMYAHPMSVDSIPTSGNQEDHVSMATGAAYRLLEMLENVATVITIELLASCQGIDLQNISLPSSTLGTIHKIIREKSPYYDRDRSLSLEIQTIKEMVLTQSFEFEEIFHELDVFSI